MKMRATWDALASDPDAYVGDPDARPQRARRALRPARRRPARRDVRRGRLRPRAHDGRARGALRPRPGASTSRRRCSSGRARRSRTERVDFRVVSGERLDGVDDGSRRRRSSATSCSSTCPRARRVVAYLAEFARVLAAGRRGVRAAAGARRRPAPARVARRALGRSCRSRRSARRDGASSAASA